MSEEKRAKLPFYSPRIWHGMSAGVWFPFLTNNRCAVAPKFWPMAGIISASSLFNSSMGFLSELIYSKKANSTDFEHPPLFVLGHWRTGTTLLHELLVKDEQFAYPTTYQCMAPHHFLLTTGTVGPIIDVLMPKHRPMDNMVLGHSRPQEDEFALVNLGAQSNYLDWAFPNLGKDYDDWLTLENLSDEEIAKWKSTFMWFLKRLNVFDPRRQVLKSPTHTARVKTILELLPDAKFIHIVRDPLSVLPSTLRMWTRMTDSLAFQTRKDEITLQSRIDVFARMYERFNEERPLIPDENFAEVKFEELVADPISELRRIYEGLSLGDFSNAEAGINEYLENTKDFQGNKHQLSPEIEEAIRHGCADYIQRYGYQ